MKWVIKDYDTPIIEVWESFNGDLYFVAEKHPDYCFGFVRLYNMPDCAEWGDFPTFEAQSLVYKKTLGHPALWKVTQQNWSNINSYEQQLFNKEVAKNVA